MTLNHQKPQYEPLLKQIGLTDNEIKTYLFLLKNGTSTKSPLVKATAISGSKVYEVLHRLSQKGLASITIKNNIQHFTASSPEKIKEYLKRKKSELSQAEHNINQIIPSLLSITQSTTNSPQIAIFTGWEGLATVYDEALSHIPRGKKEPMCVIGASSGQNTKQTQRFFTKYGRLAIEKGDLRIIFNTSNRQYVERIEKTIGLKYNKRFLFHKTPTELTVIGNTAFIVLLHQEPMIIRIKNKETADSFKQYFNFLWSHAEE